LQSNCGHACHFQGSRGYTWQAQAGTREFEGHSLRTQPVRRALVRAIGQRCPWASGPTRLMSGGALGAHRIFKLVREPSGGIEVSVAVSRIVLRRVGGSGGAREGAAETVREQRRELRGGRRLCAHRVCRLTRPSSGGIDVRDGTKARLLPSWGQACTRPWAAQQPRAQSVGAGLRERGSGPNVQLCLHALARCAQSL
jgi:hypothetical protein